ncbi:M20/M25/M40 family metallo-hydrolase [Neptunicella sp.]|uniref:M20/M25/M40 family metallo-hydrolase n=1 Tax=Neptunicella sp. TaxID=2125986 RepID=UPI003F68CD45
MANCQQPVIVQTVDGQQLWRDLQILSSDEMQGRELGHNQRAQQFLSQRFQQMGLSQFHLQYMQIFTHEYLIGSVQGANVIGWLKGQQYPQQYIVISAHYDHLGKQRGKIYNGADDNASGVAGLLALANGIREKRLRHSVIFLATDGEEKGFYGATAFIKSPPVALGNIKLNVNMDMIAYPGSKQALYLAGAKAYPQLDSIVELSLAQAGVCLKRGHEGVSRGYNGQRINWRKSSDHRVFDQQGIPFLYFGVNDHRYYHTEHDDIDNINPLFYQAAVETILNTLKIWDSAN